MSGLLFFQFLALVGFEQGDGTQCRDQQSSGLLVSPRENPVTRARAPLRETFLPLIRLHMGIADAPLQFILIL